MANLELQHGHHLVVSFRQDKELLHVCDVCCSEEEAFKNSVESITGPISRTISKEGMPAVYNALDDAGKKEFEKVHTGHVLTCCSDDGLYSRSRKRLHLSIMFHIM